MFLRGDFFVSIIDVAGLNFDYPGKRVLHDVSFKIAPGSVTALVGPNGAGKTTLLRCIVGLDRPHSGSIHIGGVDVEEDPRAVHRQIGYLSDFFGLYNDLTVRQCLAYMAWSQKVPKDKVAARVDEVAKEVLIDNMLDRKAAVLSRGYRQRLGIGLALIHNPQIVILDEPASGMDPEARIQLSRLVRRLKAQNKTLIVSSHILNELEDYCTEMLVIRDGRVAKHVVLQDFEAEAKRILKLSITGLSDKHLGMLQQRPELIVEGIEGETVTCGLRGGRDVQQRLLVDLMRSGLPVYDYHAVTHSLQEAYMNVAESNGGGTGT